MEHHATREHASRGTRRWHRYSFDVPIQVILLRDTREVILKGRGTLMNEGGIAVNVDTKLQVGSQLQVEFAPPYCGLPLRVRGEVRDVCGSNYGVEFRPSDTGEEQEIELFRVILRSAANHLPR